MTFTAQDVANLRQKTGAGIMECKNALKEANGNFERAGEILRQKGLIQAAKKAEHPVSQYVCCGEIFFFAEDSQDDLFGLHRKNDQKDYPQQKG